MSILNAPDDGQHRSYGGGSGTGVFYTLEARTTVAPALISLGVFGHDNFILTDKWQRIPVVRGECGVPIAAWNLPEHQIAVSCDLFNYEAAIALAHVFIAQLVAPVFHAVHDVEVRLVKVEIKYSYETKELGVGEIINRSDGPSPHWDFKERETAPIPLSARDEPKEVIA